MTRLRHRMRGRWPVAFLIACLVGTAGLALAQSEVGGLIIRRTLPHAHDDRPITFGATSAAPDVSISWETTGAEDHLSAVVASGAGLLVSSDADVDRSGSLAAGSTYLGVCSDDEASPTECLTARHDGTDGIVASASGRLVFAPTSGLTSIWDANADYFVTFSGSDPQSTNFVHNANNQNGYITTVSQSFLQTTMAIRGGAGTAGGRQLIITDFDHRALDHGLATPTNPTLRLQAASDPTGAGANHNADFFHNQTDGHWQINAGDAVINPASGYVQQMRRVQSRVVNFDSASPTTIATVQDGDVVTDIWAEVTTIWDGNGTVDVGDGAGDASGFIADAGLAKGSTGYRGTNRSGLGTYLWSVADTAPRTYAYTGADTIDATVVQGTSTQGAMKVYVELARLK